MSDFKAQSFFQVGLSHFAHWISCRRLSPPKEPEFIELNDTDKPQDDFSNWEIGANNTNHSLPF